MERAISLLLALLLLFGYLAVSHFLTKRHGGAPLRLAHRYTEQNMPDVSAHEAYLTYLWRGGKKGG